MSHDHEKRGLARLTPLQARLVLLVTFVMAALFVAITLSPLKSGFADAPLGRSSDVALYTAEIDRMQAGESYYAAADAELRSRGYPTRSVFNWRTPLPAVLVAASPDRVFAQALLAVAGIGTVLLAFGVLTDEGSPRQALAGVLLLSGAILPCFLGDLFVMPELWSGIFVALSTMAYGSGRVRLAVATGLAALFLRELAAPYVVVCMGLATWHGRRSELIAWLLGLAAYLVFYAVHLANIAPLIGADDVAHEHGWIRFGGAAFVISTAQMSAYLLLLPQWLTALYLAAALLGFAGWQSTTGQRCGITVALYVVAFGIVGQDFNQYWGSMTAPLLCLGAARCGASLRDLWLSVVRNTALERVTPVPAN